LKKNEKEAKKRKPIEKRLKNYRKKNYKHRKIRNVKENCFLPRNYYPVSELVWKDKKH